MAAAAGIISRINIKDTTEDQFGNNKLKSYQLEGDDKWYGLGKTKGDTINVRKGKDNVGLKVGDEVEFFFEETEFNGKTYYNAKSSQIKLVAQAAGGASSKPQVASKPANGTKPSPVGSSAAKVPYEAGIKVGHAINNAVQLVCAEEGPITLEDIERKAIAILKLSRKMEQNFDAIFDNSYQTLGTKQQAAPAPEPGPTPDPEPEPEKKTTNIDDFDDDVPF